MAVELERRRRGSFAQLPVELGDDNPVAELSAGGEVQKWPLVKYVGKKV